MFKTTLFKNVASPFDSMNPMAKRIPFFERLLLLSLFSKIFKTSNKNIKNNCIKLNLSSINIADKINTNIILDLNIGAIFYIEEYLKAFTLQ